MHCFLTKLEAGSVVFQDMATQHATRMVLYLTYDDKSKYVAVPMDKDLGSSETSAEIARAFGVSAGRVESISVVTIRNAERVKQVTECGGVTWVNKQEKKYLNIPLNLNWHDLAHPANARINKLLLNVEDLWKVEVKFTIERSFREHE